MKLELIESKNMIEDDKEYRKELYELGKYKVEVYYTNDVRRDIYVWRDEAKEEYLPDIHLRKNDIWEEEKYEKFVIQTTAYGRKDVEEIQQIIAGYQEAAAVVEILTKEFIK